MSASDRPSALAFSRSMSICSCGLSSRPFGRTAASFGFCAAMTQQLVARLHQLLVAQAARSTSCMSKPVALPSSMMAGGVKAKIIASRTLRQRRHGALRDGEDGALVAAAHRPVLQVDEAEGGVLAAPAEAEAGDGEDAVHVVLLVFKEVVLHRLDQLERALHRGTGRQRDLS